MRHERARVQQARLRSGQHRRGLRLVVTASAFRSAFGEDYGVTLTDSPLAGLLSRAVVVLDADGTVLYTQQVSEIGEEPDYEAAVAALS